MRRASMTLVVALGLSLQGGLAEAQLQQNFSVGAETLLSGEGLQPIGPDSGLVPGNEAQPRNDTAVPPPPPDPTPTPPPPPPPPPPPDALKVFIAVNGQTTGPFDATQLEQMARSGQLTKTTLVWMEGMAGWKAAGEVIELKTFLAEVVPPPPEFDAVRFMTGSWQSEPQPLQVPQATNASLEGTIDYRSDGTFEGYGTMTMTVQGFTNRMNFTLKGTWTVQNVTKQSFVLNLKGQATYQMDYGPFTEQLNSSTRLKVVDQNTVASDQGIRSFRVR